MEQAKAQNGLVGFFDILGYQSFLENNDPEAAASDVLNIITNIGNTVASSLLTSIHAEKREAFQEVVDGIKWPVFSDTILMTMEWQEKGWQWLVFSTAAMSLCRQMFASGLPLRGAIKNGKYVVSQSCFAGRVIVDAYHAQRSLNLAACSIDQGLVDLIRTKEEAKIESKITEVIDRIAVKYMTPLIDGQYKKVYLLDYLIPQPGLPRLFPADLSQLVLDSFWAHRKDIDAGAEIKARNTERFFRFLFNRFPDDFAERT